MRNISTSLSMISVHIFCLHTDLRLKCINCRHISTMVIRYGLEWKQPNDGDMQSSRNVYSKIGDSYLNIYF